MLQMRLIFGTYRNKELVGLKRGLSLEKGTQGMFLLYRFSCGRWLAKNMDDGSTERLLVAELMKCKGTLEGRICFIIFHQFSKHSSSWLSEAKGDSELFIH